MSDGDTAALGAGAEKDEDLEHVIMCGNLTDQSVPFFGHLSSIFIVDIF